MESAGGFAGWKRGRIEQSFEASNLPESIKA
jgi:hypothetical protein